MYKIISETRTNKYYRMLILDTETHDWITYNCMPMTSGGPGWFRNMDGDFITGDEYLTLFKFVFPSRELSIFVSPVGRSGSL